MKNPCGMKKMSNPCGMKNPCAGSSLKASDITRPNKSKTYRVTSRKHDKIAKEGKALWNDPSLSSNGLSCQSCHMQGANFNKSYSNSYPHRVEMVSSQAGISSGITAEQMVQFCMVVPMAAKPLDWDSRELAALTMYVEESSQPAFAMLSRSNPCGTKMARNPCNPCGMTKVNNPCGMKHNPCGMKNPCNPCAK
jgi:cytochrome c